MEYSWENLEEQQCEFKPISRAKEAVRKLVGKKLSIEENPTFAVYRHEFTNYDELLYEVSACHDFEATRPCPKPEFIDSDSYERCPLLEEAHRILQDAANDLAAKEFYELKERREKIKLLKRK
jgi:hypothetical protein